MARGVALTGATPKQAPIALAPKIPVQNECVGIRKGDRTGMSTGMSTANEKTAKSVEGVLAVHKTRSQDATRATAVSQERVFPPERILQDHQLGLVEVCSTMGAGVAIPKQYCADTSGGAIALTGSRVGFRMTQIDMAGRRWDVEQAREATDGHGYMSCLEKGTRNALRTES